jgi:hypothetical protein
LGSSAFRLEAASKHGRARGISELVPLIRYYSISVLSRDALWSRRNRHLQPLLFAHFAEIALARPLMDSKKPTKLLDWRTDLVTGARNHRNSPLLPVAI